MPSPQSIHFQYRLVTRGGADVKLIPRIAAVADIRIQVIKIIANMRRKMRVELIFQIRPKFIKILSLVVKHTTTLES